MKVLLVVLGPFAFVLWWIIIRRVSNGYRAKRLIACLKPTWARFLGLGIEISGTGGQAEAHSQLRCAHWCRSRDRCTAAHLFYNSGDQQFFVGVLAGIFSPAILVTAYKLIG